MSLLKGNYGLSNIVRVSDVRGGVVYEDIKFPASTVKLDSANPPSAQAYKGGQVLSFASNPSQKIYFNIQLNHAWKMGDLDAHLHIILPVSGAGAGVENIKFDLTYSWAYIGYTFPVETTISVTRDVQNDLADKHIYLDIGDILEANASGTQSNGVSSMLLCSLRRDTTVVNDYGSAVYLAEVDAHIQKNSIGSLYEASKGF